MNTPNLFKRTLVAALASCSIASAAVLNFNGTPNEQIPDNNANGLGYGFAVTTGFSSIDSVVVTLNISGGYNGDLYAFLSHGSGLAVLLNRVGVTGIDANGYPDTGFNNITLSPGATDVHDYRTTLGGAPSGGMLTGNWAADGRLLPTDLSRPNTLDVFNGIDPNGAWTLFLADRSPANIATLQSWAVDITVVPEPVNITLGIFGILLITYHGLRRWRRFAAEGSTH